MQRSWEDSWKESLSASNSVKDRDSKGNSVKNHTVEIWDCEDNVSIEDSIKIYLDTKSHIGSQNHCQVHYSVDSSQSCGLKNCLDS